MKGLSESAANRDVPAVATVPEGVQTIRETKGPPPQLESLFVPPTAFMTPVFLPESAWLQHLPFAFWLTGQQRPRAIVELGTHRGASYFGFCQAVAHLGLPTRCYAVDTWKGDDHSGHYGADIYRSVEAHNSALYSGFSTLMRMRFAEALEYFPDGDVDLLHIDGFHTYEAAREDFDTWLPKLSDRGIVLLHDTNVRRSQFGVFQLIDELRSSYPVFEFFHGHGLGVVATGRDSAASLGALFFEDAAEGGAKSTIREIFARLGKACDDSHRSTVAKADLASHGETLAERDGQLEQSKAVLTERDGALAEARAMLAEREDSLAAAQAALAERDSALAEAKAAREEREAALVKTQAALAERDKTLTETVETLVSLEKLMIGRAETIDALELRGMHSDMLRNYTIRSHAPSFPALRHQLHLWIMRRALRRSALFDAGWYLRTNPDVAKRKKDPALHYLTHGACKGLDPGPNFSTIGYLLDHEDVRLSGANPLVHYIRRGRKEGRNIRNAGD